MSNFLHEDNTGKVMVYYAAFNLSLDLKYPQLGITICLCLAYI